MGRGELKSTGGAFSATCQGAARVLGLRAARPDAIRGPRSGFRRGAHDQPPVGHTLPPVASRTALRMPALASAHRPQYTHARPNTVRSDSIAIACNWVYIPKLYSTLVVQFPHKVTVATKESSPEGPYHTWGFLPFEAPARGPPLFLLRPNAHARKVPHAAFAVGRRGKARHVWLHCRLIVAT